VGWEEEIESSGKRGAFFDIFPCTFGGEGAIPFLFWVRCGGQFLFLWCVGGFGGGGGCFFFFFFCFFVCVGFFFFFFFFSFFFFGFF